MATRGKGKAGGGPPKYMIYAIAVALAAGAGVLASLLFGR